LSDEEAITSFGISGSGKPEWVSSVKAGTGDLVPGRGPEKVAKDLAGEKRGQSDFERDPSDRQITKISR